LGGCGLLGIGTFTQINGILGGKNNFDPPTPMWCLFWDGSIPGHRESRGSTPFS
jgi:hypothetical protein